MPCLRAVQELMKELDKDGSGKIDAEELLEAVKGEGLNLEEVKAFIKEIDKNGDGQVDIAELYEYFERQGV
nr:calcium binding mitochondrial carrier protein [Hymenolepis microstoma]